MTVSNLSRSSAFISTIVFTIFLNCVPSAFPEGGMVASRLIHPYSPKSIPAELGLCIGVNNIFRFPFVVKTKNCSMMLSRGNVAIFQQ